MRLTRVYDIPTRLFHWLFAANFLGAFFIAKTMDDDSPYFSYHMILGLILTALVLLRTLWGVIGSQYARFSSFALNPTDLLNYFRQILSGSAGRRLGHNPASSWAALLMMALALGLGVTGYLMTSGGHHETLEEIHELLANSFIVVVIAHLAGIALHTLRHRDGIALSMLHGKKLSATEQEEGISHSHLGAGIVFLALMGAFVFQLNRNYDASTQTLNLFGNTLQLGEAEKERQ